MTELEKEELERKVTGSDSVKVEEAKNNEVLPDHVADVRDVFWKWEQKSRLIV